MKTEEAKLIGYIVNERLLRNKISMLMFTILLCIVVICILIIHIVQLHNELTGLEHTTQLMKLWLGISVRPQ